MWKWISTSIDAIADVDCSKLKRGRKEYQQFLQELRQTDPQAFASQ